MNYLRLFEQAVDQIIGHEVNQLINPRLMEAGEPVGREFQHIEDLVYIYGPAGAKKAIDRIASIGKNSKHMELKWDGSPAIIFGRDENGTFHFGDKYSKEIIGSGRDVYNQYVGRSGANVSDERKQFAGEMSQLYDLYEAATPKDFRGFLEGALLYKTKPQQNKNGEYFFQPNTVIYYVAADSNLGKRIAQSVTASTATAYFDNLPALGGQRQAVGDKWKSVGSKDVIILPPKFATDVQADIPEEAIQNLYQYLSAHKSKIEKFVTPSAEWNATFKDPSQGPTKWREVIYKYVNSQVDNPAGMENLGTNMAQWAEGDPILAGGKRREIAINDIKNAGDNLTATFRLVRGIMRVKDEVVDQLEHPTLSSIGIRAELPGGAKGGEGFVSDPSGGKQPLKFVKRGTFTAANRAKGRVSMKESADGGKTAVVGWGRGMGHQGHMYLAESVIHYANKIGATPFFYVSETVGKDDPLTTNEKLSIYKTVFPKYKNIFKSGKSPIDVITQVYESGYTNLVFVVGEDQKASFQFLAKPTKSTGQLPVPFDSVKVMSRQETGSASSGEAGPRATPMREILRNPDATTEQKFKAWRAAMPKALSDEQVTHYMRLAAERMGVPIADEQVDEADNPNYFGAGGGSPSAIPGTPQSLQQQPTEDDIRRYHKEMRDIKRFMSGH
jgi:hypothetical protein